MLNVIIIIISAIITQCIIIILFNKMKMLNLIPVKWSINSKSLNLVPVYNSNLKVFMKLHVLITDTKMPISPALVLYSMYVCMYVCMCKDVRPVSTTIRLLLYYYIKSLPLLLKYCTCIVFWS